MVYLLIENQNIIPNTPSQAAKKVKIPLAIFPLTPVLEANKTNTLEWKVL